MLVHSKFSSKDVSGITLPCGRKRCLTCPFVFNEVHTVVGPRGKFAPSGSFLCQLTCQSADIMSSLCGVGVRARVNNFSSKTTRPRDVLFFLKDTLSIEDEKLFKACKSVCSSVC